MVVPKKFLEIGLYRIWGEMVQPGVYWKLQAIFRPLLEINVSDIHAIKLLIMSTLSRCLFGEILQIYMNKNLGLPVKYPKSFNITLA